MSEQLLEIVHPKVGPLPCSHCNFVNYVTEDFVQARREDGQQFYCTACGAARQFRREPSVDDVRRMLEGARQQLGQRTNERDNALAEVENLKAKLEWMNEQLEAVEQV